VFDYCAGSADYKNGITLVFAVTRGFQWNMNFYNASWQLNPGSSYQVTYSIDSYGSSNTTATAIATNEVQVLLPPNQTLFRYFMRGNQLKLITSSQTFLFDLTDTSQLLPDLLSCVESYVGTAPSSSNPF
jgi:hypothetical protein